ncbi:vomeronasal type-2 receptor 26-like [Pleurodeles waltl]|uniref:vomeronasal type-2 receptor 26-like n=1 Tax=Pleurodeles waltl TaxID=8319 RepID=UPI003709AFF0
MADYSQNLWGSFQQLLQVLVFIYAVEEINRNPALLPNLTLGYHIFDSCASEMKALQSTLSIMSQQNEPVPNYRCQSEGALVGFIGDLSSSTTYSMAQLLALYKYPQISYGAQDPVLSDRLRFPSFYRTVPSELSFFIGVAQLLRHFGWTWVGILTTDDDSGELALRELREVIGQVGGCIDFFHMIPPYLSSADPLNLDRVTETISYGAQDPVLSDRLRFPSFYRTVPSELSFFIGVAQLLRHFGWTWVGILTTDDDSGELALRELREVNRFLQKIYFKTSSGHDIVFDDKGQVPAKYDILNWAFNRLYVMEVVKVGHLDLTAQPGQQLIINESAITWHVSGDQKNQAPRSVCSESCLPGSRRAPRGGKPVCCFYCVPCADGQFSNRTDMENCLQCPEDQWPNAKKDGCNKRVIVFLSYSDILGVILFTVAIIFSAVTVGVLGIFLRHRDTPIVKANNRDLSYTLLTALILAFLCSLLFIGRPATWTCLIQQAAFGIIFTIAVSCVLAKTITVVIAFNATRPGSRLSRWLGSRVSGSIVLFCTLGEVTICLSWLLTAPPHPGTDIRSETGKMILQCDQGSVTAFYSVIGYMGLLALASFIVAFLARNLPDKFNEAKLITFSMLVFCSVWVSFFPAYISTKGRYMVAVEIFAILASSAGLLGCIFIPKCYTILFRQDINTREHLTLHTH